MSEREIERGEREIGRQFQERYKMRRGKDNITGGGGGREGEGGAETEGK